MKARVLIVFVLLITGCDSFPESEFDLAKSSDIPAFISIPSGLSRKDISIRLTLYGSEIRAAVFTVYGPWRRKIETIELDRAAVHGYFDSKGQKLSTLNIYPMYVVYVFNGTSDVIEHRGSEPYFYVAKDSNLLNKLGVSRAN